SRAVCKPGPERSRWAQPGTRKSAAPTFSPSIRTARTRRSLPPACAIWPAPGRPWCVVNERDELGDNTPFEYATEVKEGAFYGWPWYYIGANEDPRHKGARPDLKDKVSVPDVLMQAHSAPLQIAFYEGDNFPAAYKGSAFVTFHGSCNRAL